MHKITNKMDDVRRLWDSYHGRSIFVGPGETVSIKKNPPKEKDVWAIDVVEEPEQKEEKPRSRKKREISMEVIEDDSSSDL